MNSRDFIVTPGDDLLFLATPGDPTLSIHKTNIPTPEDLLLFLDYFLHGKHFTHSLVLFHGAICSMFVNIPDPSKQLPPNAAATAIANAETRTRRGLKPITTIHGPALIFGRKVLDT